MKDDGSNRCNDVASLNQINLFLRKHSRFLCLCISMYLSIYLKFYNIFAQQPTGCSLNIVFFEDYEIYSGLWPLSVSSRCQCVYTMAGHNPALQSRTCRAQKNHNISRKNIILNEHPVKLDLFCEKKELYSS